MPTLDPRGWQPLDTETYPARSPVAVSIELIDEMHSLELAIDRLAMDAALRQTLGQAAHRWWEEHHQLDSMADAYQRVLHAATRAPQRSQAPLPAHLIDEGWSRAETIAREMGIGAQLDALRHT